MPCSRTPQTVRPVGEIIGYAATVSQLHGRHFALLGNAAEFLDPVFSSGVTIAMKSASLAAAVLERQLRGESVDWEREFAAPLMYGVETFRAFVTGWYDGTLQDVIFFPRAAAEHPPHDLLGARRIRLGSLTIPTPGRRRGGACGRWRRSAARPELMSALPSLSRLTGCGGNTFLHFLYARSAASRRTGPMSAALPQVTPQRGATASRSGARWDAQVYLAHYYSCLEPTEQATLRFVVETLRREPPFERALEFGAGPTLHHALALAGRTRELHLADLLPENLCALRRWLGGEPGAHDWSAFTREVLRLEGVASSDDRQLAEREALLRRRTTRLLHADARRQDPLGNMAGDRYGCVTSFFCADSATHTLVEWRHCLRNIAGLLAPGGLLIMATLRCCRSWRSGNSWLPSPGIDELQVRRALDYAGFEAMGRVLEVAELPDQLANGFTSILLVSARKPRR